jgi:hypothetical protein
VGLPWVVLAAALVLVLGAAVRHYVSGPSKSAATRSIPVPTTAGVPAAPPVGAPAEDGAEPAPLRRLQVIVYFPSAMTTGLVGEPREIFETASPGDRVKQIIADLISGPHTGDAVALLPASTRLRQAYVLEDGTAYLDFSQELRQNLGGGSSDELLAVYSIVDSVTVNVPEVHRVGILIEGQPVDTLGGHVDLRRPLPPDLTLIEVDGPTNVVRGPHRGARRTPAV